jgi:hypothetical protein
MRAHFFLLATLAGTPLLSAAQTPPLSPKFYVGVGASILTDAVFRYYPYASNTAVVSPVLTLGWQFTPQLSAQLGASYHWQTQDESYPDVYTSRTRTRSLTAPILLRYAFLPAPNRFHLDALGGITIRYATSSYDEIYYDPAGSRQPRLDSGDVSFTDANLTLGPAVRYSLSPQFELSAMPLVNLALNKSYGDVRNRLFWYAQVGINYTFGQ